MKLDKNGKKRWEKYFDGYTRNLILANLSRLDANNYMIGIGTGPHVNTPLDQLSYSGQVLFLDSLMNVKKKWESSYSLEHGIVNDPRILPDGRIAYLTGRLEVFVTEKYTVQQPKFVLRDRDLNLISERTIGIPNSPYNLLYNTASSPDGNYVSSGQLYVDGDRGDVNGRFIATFALTASGSVVWDTRSVVSGLYYYRLTSSGGGFAAGKILVSH